MHPVLLVAGASGGLGTSTLAAVAARCAGAVLVDGDPHGPGVDATLALEDAPGLRWPDLSGLEGAVDAERLVRRLPGEAPPVLSAAGPCGVSAGILPPLVQALAETAPVVVDLPGSRVARSALLESADRVVLLVGLRPRQVRDGLTVARSLTARGVETVVVTRGARRAERVGDEVATHLGVPWLDHLEDHPLVLRDEGRGIAPRDRGPVGRVARQIALLASASGRPADPLPLVEAAS